MLIYVISWFLVGNTFTLLDFDPCQFTLLACMHPIDFLGGRSVWIKKEQNKLVQNITYKIYAA